jgi:ATP/maltotriose-dependent transcriptional regulator MalT
MLKVAQLPPASVSAKSQINELDEGKKTSILALDDYHVIRDKSVHGLIAKLLHHPSSLMHFVLAPHLTISIVALCNT